MSNVHDDIVNGDFEFMRTVIMSKPIHDDDDDDIVGF